MTKFTPSDARLGAVTLHSLGALTPKQLKAVKTRRIAQQVAGYHPTSLSFNFRKDGSWGPKLP